MTAMQQQTRRQVGQAFLPALMRIAHLNADRMSAPLNHDPNIVTIRDGASGSSAEILVSQGFNCFRFTAMPSGRPVEVIYAPADFADRPGRPAFAGRNSAAISVSRPHSAGRHSAGKASNMHSSRAMRLAMRFMALPCRGRGE